MCVQFLVVCYSQEAAPKLLIINETLMEIDNLSREGAASSFPATVEML